VSDYPHFQESDVIDFPTVGLPRFLKAIATVLLTGCAPHVVPQSVSSSGTAILDGLVLTPDGAPVAGAQITVVVEGGPVAFEVLALTTTDVDGRFVVRELPPGDVNVSAASDEHAPAVHCGQELVANQVTTSPRAIA
jgi:hypothetical protein